MLTEPAASDLRFYIECQAGMKARLFAFIIFRPTIFFGSCSTTLQPRLSSQVRSTWLRAGPSLVGWKVVTIIGAHSWGGGSKKTLRTVDGPLLCVFTKAYYLQVFLSLANLNIQKSLKHSNTRRGKAQLSARAPCSVLMQRAASHRQQDRTELYFTSSCTWMTNTNHSLNMQTEKDVKEPNSAPTRLKALEHRICLFLLLYRQIHTKLCQIPISESILEKTVVMS